MTALIATSGDFFFVFADVVSDASMVMRAPSPSAVADMARQMGDVAYVNEVLQGHPDAVMPATRAPSPLPDQHPLKPVEALL